MTTISPVSGVSIVVDNSFNYSHFSLCLVDATVIAQDLVITTLYVYCQL